MMIINNQLTEQEDIGLDRGYFFGFGVFETILIHNNQPILLKEHIERLNKGLETLRINRCLQEEILRQQINLLPGANCCLKIAVSEQNVILHKRPNPYIHYDYNLGFKLKVSALKRDPKAHTTYLKSLNYMDNLLEKQIAVEEGYQEVLFLNFENFVAEGSMSNLFFIKENQIHTPALTCGLLPGVMRNWILQHHYVTEGKYTLEDILSSEGVFITNSLLGIMKVHQIGSMTIQDHDKIKELQQGYADFLEVNQHESTY